MTSRPNDGQLRYRSSSSGDPKVRESVLFIDERFTSVQLGPNVMAIDDVAFITDAAAAADAREGDAKAAITRFIEAFGDDYDFVQVTPDRYWPTAAAATYTSVSNDVLGIGLPLFNLSNAYGSTRLQGAIWQNRGLGPGAMKHEIAHRWAARGLGSLGFHQCASFGHWGVVGNGKGILGGFDPATLVAQGSNRFSASSFGPSSNVLTDALYAPIELYMMGLVPASAVPDFQVPRDVECNSLVYETQSTSFSASGIDSVSMDQVVDLLGERIPRPGVAPVSFRYAFVVVADEALTPLELAYTQKQARLFKREFAEATQGLGSIDVAISATAPVSEPALTGFELPQPSTPNANCPAGFFIARVDDGPGEGVSSGVFGMELLLDEPGTRILAGGLNFGGLIDVSQVGFAGANIANPASEDQLLNLSVTGSPTANPSGSLPVRITINRRTGDDIVEVFSASAEIDSTTPFTASLQVSPGYYETLVAAEGFPASAAGGVPEGQFFFSLTTQFVDRLGGGFQGGAVVGGYHAENPFGGVSGFASFCIATPHYGSTRVLGAPSYGLAGAADLRLQLLDASQDLLISLPEDRR